MKLSLFIKSYEHDFDWLVMVRESVRKFANGFFHEVVLVLPVGQAFDWPEAKIHWVHEERPGYHFQMSVKCHADTLCSGDLIVFGDSDTCFTRQLRMEDFLKDGKPIWLFSPFSEARKDQSVWIQPMHKFVGRAPTIETMRRHCHQWPREFFPKLREFCLKYHRQTLHDYIMAQAHPEHDIALTFSEFNCGGWFANQFTPELFSWVDAKDATQLYVFQSFTHGGEERKKADLEEMKRLLAPSELRVVDPPIHAPIQIIEAPAGISAQIRGHVEIIKALVEPSKVGRTQMLHAELRKAGLLGPAVKRKAKR